MDALVSINGAISSPEEGKVSVFDRGFLFGDGVYETGRSYARKVLFLEEHLTRLRRSAEKLFIPVPWEDSYVKQTLFDLARAFGESDTYFRTIITRGPITYVGLDNFTDVKPTLVHICQKLPLDKLQRLRQEGMTVMTSKIIRNAADSQDPNIKTSNYLNSLLALHDAKARGGDDAIMCNRTGEVTEGTTFSVFGVTAKGAVITPALGIGILDSITRRHVISSALPKFAVEEGYYGLEGFKECREVFIASSLKEIVPIRVWDERRFPEVPGPVTIELQTRLTQSIQSYLETQEAF